MIELKINGKTQQLDVSGDMPLLWALRDIVKLTGSKYGCGKGLCGACTVHINGEATRSCILPVSAAVGQEITTIEGLSENADHPLQKAWIELNVPQCGYCQSGQIMSAATLLSKNASPTDDDIDQAMSGNICRCGTYPRIKNAIHLAAKLATEVK
ncbi:MAG: (2Fe-2S)-binding protein [Gammaproteobacteria bacterium]|nr:MAG: (2Fe-2S)-binding protein [Gammaproteobacteria bacterium]